MTIAGTLHLAIETHTLANGLRVICHPDPALPLIAVNLWYHVGSKNERPGRTGFAHLFEHMLFQGSQHVGTNDHFRYVQQAGGVANGSTWFDRTNYYETLPAHQLELALWLEADRMGFLLPAMTQEKLDTQRDVVMNERRQTVDNRPYGQATERLFELLYPPDHPYHWPVIGYMEDIAAATLEDVQGFFHTYYTPNNAVLTVAGMASPDEVLRAAEQFFGPIPRGPEPPPVEAPAVPLGGERRLVLEDDVRLPRVYVGFRVPAYGDRRWYAADLFATVLAGGKSSPLYDDLVYRRQIAQSVSASVYATEEAGTFILAATARPGVDPEELETAVLAHLEADGMTAQDLERAHNRTVAELYLGLQRLDQKADLLSQCATYFGDPRRMEQELDEYLALESRHLLEARDRFLRRDDRAVVTVVPRRQAR